MVRRRLWLAVGITVGLTALVALAVGLLPDRWTAEALVVLNARPAKIASLQSPTESLLSRTDADLSVVRTETEIITSDGLLRTTAERLGLATDAAFEGKRQGDGLLGRITSSLGQSRQDDAREADRSAQPGRGAARAIGGGRERGRLLRHPHPRREP